MSAHKRIVNAIGACVRCGGWIGPPMSRGADRESGRCTYGEQGGCSGVASPHRGFVEGDHEAPMPVDALAAKSAVIKAAEDRWYAAEQRLQEAARAATADFLSKGPSHQNDRTRAERQLQIAACDFAEAHAAMREALK